MVVVAANGGQPVRQEGGEICNIAVVDSPVSVLAPYHIAESVGVVEEAGLEHLLVQARTVEACGKSALNILYQSLLAGRSVDAVGVEALVENQAHEGRLAV